MITDLTTGAIKRPELRAEVQAAIVAALGAVGFKRVTQSAIVNRFLSPDDATLGPGGRLRTLDRLAKIVADLERRAACLRRVAAGTGWL